MNQPGTIQVQTALDAIVQFVQQVDYSRLPVEVTCQAKRLLLEGISWMVLGARTEEAQRLLVVPPVGTGLRQSTVIGTTRKMDFLDAVLVNAALAQVHDCSDTRRLARRDSGSNHPGRGVIPVALTLGERYRLAGTELLQLLVVGYEVVSHVGVRHPGHEYSYGVAAMAGRTARLSDEALQRALLLGQLSFPFQAAQVCTTDFDFVKQGLIAHAAVSSAMYASACLTLPTDNCDLSIATPFPDPDAVGIDAYAMMNIDIKPYVCCRALHGAVDLALEIRARVETEASRIATVEVRVGNNNPLTFQSVGPNSYYKLCQFSIPYVVACAFLDGAVDEHSFTRERILADDVQAFQQKVTVIHDESLQFNPAAPVSLARPAVLKVVTTDGRAMSQATVFPRGSPVTALSEEQLRAKFTAWTGPSFSESRKDEIIDMVERIEHVSDVGELVSLLATDHDLGGVRMGDDPGTSVLNGG